MTNYFYNFCSVSFDIFQLCAVCKVLLYILLNQCKMTKNPISVIEIPLSTDINFYIKKVNFYLNFLIWNTKSFLSKFNYPQSRNPPSLYRIHWAMEKFSISDVMFVMAFKRDITISPFKDICMCYSWSEKILNIPLSNRCDVIASMHATIFPKCWQLKKKKKKKRRGCVARVIGSEVDFTGWYSMVAIDSSRTVPRTKRARSNAGLLTLV